MALFEQVHAVHKTFQRVWNGSCGLKAPRKVRQVLLLLLEDFVRTLPIKNISTQSYGQLAKYKE